MIERRPLLSSSLTGTGTGTARAAVALAALALSACASADPAPDTGPREALGEAEVVLFKVTAETGPREGPNAFAITLHTADDTTPLEDAALQVRAHMPSMAHAAPGNATVEELGEGRYRAQDVVFSMPGTWELHLSASTAALTDEATFFYEIP